MGKVHTDTNTHKLSAYIHKHFILMLVWEENTPGEGNGLNVPPAGLLLLRCPAGLDPESNLEFGDGVLGVSFMSRPSSVVSISKKRMF